MAQFSRMEVLNEIIISKFIPLFYHPDHRIVINCIRACVEGGCTVFEFTNRGDNAFSGFQEVIKYCNKEFPKLILGVGSIIDVGTGALYISGGANFLVGSVFNPELAKLCNRRKIAYIPGCGTATEISDAEEYGSEFIKLFPGDSAGGPNFVKAVLGPTPWTRLLITGGIEPNRESIQQWLKNGAAAIGMGSGLFQKKWIETCDYEAITKLVIDIRSWISEIF